MNVFYLSDDPEQCARETCDKHVVKMIVETAQLLCTAHRVLDNNNDDRLYKLTHKNHPSAVWCRATNSNYNWLYKLLVALLNEYTFRYKKEHKSSRLLVLLRYPPVDIPVGEFTTPPLAMPDEYKCNDAIQSYRNYYIGAKASFAKWTGRIVPVWFVKKIMNDFEIEITDELSRAWDDMDDTAIISEVMKQHFDIGPCTVIKRVNSHDGMSLFLQFNTLLEYENKNVYVLVMFSQVDKNLNEINVQTKHLIDLEPGLPATDYITPFLDMAIKSWKDGKRCSS